MKLNSCIVSKRIDGFPHTRQALLAKKAFKSSSKDHPRSRNGKDSAQPFCLTSTTSKGFQIRGGAAGNCQNQSGGKCKHFTTRAIYTMHHLQKTSTCPEQLGRESSAKRRMLRQPLAIPGPAPLLPLRHVVPRSNDQTACLEASLATRAAAWPRFLDAADIRKVGVIDK